MISEACHQGWKVILPHTEFVEVVGGVDSVRPRFEPITRDFFENRFVMDD
jgi:hypothetical protein